jgi:hypothetical protein
MDDLTKSDIEDIFIEFTDNGFEIVYYSKYFFELIKKFDTNKFDLINHEYCYGFTNLENIKRELDIFETLGEVKDRFNGRGFLIGFEFELNIVSFGGNSLKIVCHMSKK